MSTSRLVAATLVVVWSLAGCGALPIPLPCALTIVALAPDEQLAVGDPLPEGREVIAGPDDFDTANSSLVAGPDGGTTLDLPLRGDAVQRLAAHTAGHVGEPMAVAVNGEVVSVPYIMTAIDDGRISITGGLADDPTMADRLAGCVPAGVP